MKLELKYIAPYLPYGLKYATLSDNDGKYYINQNHNTIGVGGNQSNVTNICLTEYSRPLYRIYLRPLSDLTELMPNNKVSYISYLWYEIISTDSDSFDKDEFFENCELGLINFLPIIVYEQLLKWHFDVFGLIPKGLAVDINTLSIE